MPQATTLTINNAAAVAKTFTLVSPSAGYGGVADWALKEGAFSTVFPILTASATKSSNASRVCKVKLKVPAFATDSTTGLPTAIRNMEFNVTSSVPDLFPEAAKADAIAYFVNIVAAALIKEMLRDGTPAT